jgi:hypothetical protein
MWNPLNAFQEISISELNAAGETLKIKVAVGVAEDLDVALATLLKDKPQALIILADRIFLHNRARLMDFATQKTVAGSIRIPGNWSRRADRSPTSQATRICTGVPFNKGF